MTELSPQQNEKNRSELPIEQQANYEGSWTNLMIERLKNPKIRNQYIDLIYEPEELKSKEDSDYSKKTKDQIAEGLDQRTKNAELKTNISFSETGGPHANMQFLSVCMPMKWVDERNKSSEKYLKQVSMAEAHEKGHLIRFFPVLSDEIFFRNKFQNAFDVNAAIFPEPTEPSEEEKLKNPFVNSRYFSEKEHYVENNIKYLFSPTEIVERMSQLKNYFGMKGNEFFTKEHLSYSRKHYLDDVGYDNGMTQFFQAITPEKEDAFIELINSAGI